MRAFRAALLLTAGLLLGPGVATVYAGPGITFRPKDAPPLVLSGGQLRGIANLPARTYTLPPDASEPGKKVTLKGVSIAGLLGRGNINAQRVQVVKKNGGSYAVLPAQFGTAFLADDGATTYYIRSSGGVMSEFVETSDVPLEVSVDGGDLAVKVTRSRKKIKVGETVTFSARIAVGGAPNTTYTYTWDYGDGPVVGQRVTATATKDDAGILFAQVDVRDNDSTCTIRCYGSEQIEVEVGDVPEQPEDTTAGGPNGTPGGAGSSGGTGGGGTGGTGSGSGSGAGGGAEDPSTTAKPEPEPKPEPKPPPPPPKPFGQTISGLLINDTGVTVEKLPGGTPAGGAAGTRAVRGGETAGAFPLGLSGLLALLVMWVGALRERRGVRLRVA